MFYAIVRAYVLYNSLMKREEFNLQSQHDNLKLGVSLRIPDGRPRGILQLVHGMAEHRERYHDFMDFCAEQGLIVIIHDHRGHGASVKANEDYGYFYRDGVNGIVSDVHQVTDYIKNRFPGLPLILFGHSMGSLVVRCYMQKYDADVNGLIVCGSPSKRFGAGMGKFVASFLSVFLGDHHRSKFVNSLSFSNYNAKSAKLARDNGQKVTMNEHYPSANSWVVSDPAVVAAYDADERDGFTFTLNGFKVLFELMRRAYRKTGWKMQNPDAPIFFISGADDPCILTPKDFQKAVDFMRMRGYRNVSSKLYPHMRHEILNERGKMEVWRNIVDWVNQVLN